MRSAQDSALCFVVIIPAWKQVRGWKTLHGSAFCRHHLLLEQRSHGYTEGAQHQRSSRYRISTCDTSVFFLQTDAATQAWPVTLARLTPLPPCPSLSRPLLECCSSAPPVFGALGHEYLFNNRAFMRGPCRPSSRGCRLPSSRSTP